MAGKHNESDLTREFLALLGEHERRLRAFVLALVPHWDDADEIVQKTRIRLWEQFADYDRSQDFGAWARTIARYEVLTLREKVGRSKVFLETNLVESLGAQFDDVSDELEQRRSALTVCLDKLASAKRALLMDYYSGNETMRQLAERVGRSADSVRHEILRSRKAIGECIERQLAEGDRP